MVDRDSIRRQGLALCRTQLEYNPATVDHRNSLLRNSNKTEPIAPSVMWYQDSFMLDPTERRTMETRGNKHTLTLKHVQAADFGNYSCVAENSLGKSKKYMELSGKWGNSFSL
ncbi:unnamed protein product [Nezara viridula]|uniref:Ig-like domain-containing protein n=1 Tax=Nezara viridula TaxID=85310 RepID=A0A9P0H7Z6_NEZVI|nr:unnamed protein product [Nezara viridula]